MAICSRIAPSLGRGEMASGVTPYVSQVQTKILNGLHVDRWNWRAMIVGWTALRLLSVPFYIIEGALAAVASLFSLALTRDRNHPDVLQSTSWMRECAREAAISCCAPLGVPILFLYGRMFEAGWLRLRGISH